VKGVDFMLDPVFLAPPAHESPVSRCQLEIIVISDLGQNHMTQSSDEDDVSRRELFAQPLSSPGSAPEEKCYCLC